MGLGDVGFRAQGSVAHRHVKTLPKPLSTKRIGGRIYAAIMLGQQACVCGGARRRIYRGNGGWGTAGVVWELDWGPFLRIQH